MAKSFDKTREHFHVPLMLVLVNFFAVALVYFAHGYLNQNLPFQILLKTMVTIIALMGIGVSFVTQSEQLTKYIYLFSSFAIAFLFWG